MMERLAKVWIRARQTKRGRSTYHLRWVDPIAHKWKSRRVGTDRKRAEREAAKLEEALNNGTYSEMVVITWNAFVADHVAKIECLANRREATLALDQFGECTGNMPPHRVKFVMVEDFVAWLREGKEPELTPDGKKTKGRERNGQPTINKKLRYLRHALNMAIERGYLTCNPMRRWKWVAEDEPEPREATTAEEIALLAAAEELYGYRMRAFIEAALATGGRRGELTALTWDRIDLEGGSILFTHTKGKRNREVPISQDTAAVLERVKVQTQQLGGPFLGLQDNISHKWPKILEKAGIAGLTIHDLRRTFITRLVRAGVPITVVMRLAGHSKIQTTERYYTATTSDDRRDAINRLRRVSNVG